MVPLSSKIQKPKSRVFSIVAKKLCALALSACCLAPVAGRAQGECCGEAYDLGAVYNEAYQRGYETGLREFGQGEQGPEEQQPQTIWDRSQARQQRERQEEMEYWENRSSFDNTVQIIEKYPGKRDVYVNGRPVLRENHWQRRYERLAQ